MMFHEFWLALNAALTVRGEREALFKEAHFWFNWRPVKALDERLINRVVNGRKLP
jgi:hypothetical protein